MSAQKGGFTLPGESGYEKLTLKMAEKWGADVIRDSDGTVLSDEILNAGYGIYSTICIIRDHNEWAKKNMDKLQQTFLMTQPIVADSDTLTVELMKDFFAEQFLINEGDDSLKYWQVYDRTTDTPVGREHWSYADGKVAIKGITPWHKYTVSFMAYRIWEEISMYNHTTNNWTKEHLMQIDPRHEATREYMLSWMRNWCETHPDTTVVRFTSMFYNFVWIWGSSARNRNLFSDWGSYDFTVSPLALDEFAKKYGYSLTAEDFINQGKLHVTHMVGTKQKADWMEFVNDFVIWFGKQLVDIVHEYGKKAYVFYDDSWVGIEPYNGRFKEFGFDGLIKCVFSGYEARLCSGVDVPTHELRLHPYLFPVGLGGYLHLVEPFPDFCDYIEKVSDEFRTVKSFHAQGAPLSIKTKVAVLHSWGKLRSWTLSGHFHETYMNDLIHINESLSGLPVDVSFISFEDVKAGALKDVDVVINAGYAGSAWSGGDNWKDEEVVSKLTEWVYNGGTFIGVDEPSAVAGYDTYFRMAHVLGIDEDTGARICHGKWQYDVSPVDGLMPEGSSIRGRSGLYLTDGKARVVAEADGAPAMTINDFGKGKGIYMSHYNISLENTRMLFNTILFAGGEALDGEYITDNPYTECAYYPASNMLVIINNSGKTQTASVKTEAGVKTATLEAYDTAIIQM